MNRIDHLLEFFKLLCQHVENIEECDAKAASAVAVVADQLQIGKVEVQITTPVSRLRPQGEYHIAAIYEEEKDIGTQPYPLVFHIPDGAAVTITLTPKHETAFSEEEKEVLYVLFRAVFMQYSRVIMKELLSHVIDTDLDSGAATMDRLMRQAGRLMQMRRIEDYAIVFFNIHNFKYVNKVLSYAEGDVVLRKYTAYVQSMLEEEELLARPGGDNFVALLKEEKLHAFLEKLKRVRICYKGPQVEKEFIFGVTAGYSDLHNLPEVRDLMARCSIAYAVARKMGTGQIVAYTPQIKQDVMEKQSVLSDFVLALEKREFVVYYQPKVNIQGQTIYGAEALVRGIRDGEIVPPIRFIPLLEQEGSIVALDYYVLEEVCRWLKKRMDEGQKPLCISVNFSRKHLQEENLVEHIVAVIDRYQIDHRYIEIELTESEEYQNFEMMTKLVGELKAKGISTSMDDFGTGFSSLNMIKNVDLKVIKIDKSFIPLETEYPGKEKDLIMFRHIVSLVRELDKKTIAEGVETEKQLDYLKEVGCDIVQGYVFDRPLPQEQFEERLACGYE